MLRAETAQEWYEKGSAAITADKKIEYFSKAIELNPKDDQSFCYRGYAKTSKGQLDSAVEDFNNAIKIAPNSYCSHMGLGEIYIETEKYQEAVKEFSKAHEIWPAYKDALKRRAVAKKALGDSSGAEADLKEVGEKAGLPSKMKDSFQIYNILFLLLAGFSFFVGLRGVIKKKPFVFSARWLLAFMAVAFLPQIYNPIMLMNEGGTKDLNLILLISPLMFVFLMFIMWVQMRGYFVFGVTDKSFRTALHAALAKLGLKYEERLSALYLPSDDATLQVSVQSWMGTGQIKAKDRKLSPRLKQIASEMSLYFANNQVETNMLNCYVYIVLGVFMLILTGSMWSLNH